MLCSALYNDPTYNWAGGNQSERLFFRQAHHSGAKKNPTMKREEILLNRKFKLILLAVGFGGIVLKKHVQKHLAAQVTDSDRPQE